jgi:hypothetical protein
MHYKNGRLAKENDPVIASPMYPGGPYRAGKIHNLNGSCTTCNAVLVIPSMGYPEAHTITLSECYHAEDAFNAIDPQFSTPPQTPA